MNLAQNIFGNNLADSAANITEGQKSIRPHQATPTPPLTAFDKSLPGEKRSQLEILRQLVREHSPFHGVQTLPCSLIPDGLPIGGICELQGRLGTGVTEAALKILSEHPTKRCAWVERDSSFFPTASFQRGIRPGQILNIRTRDEILWAALECLRSQLFEFLVLVNPGFNERDLRRLQMMAEKSGTCVLILNHTAGLRTDSRLEQRSDQGLSLILKISRKTSSEDFDLMIERPQLSAQVLKRRMAVGAS